jgi:hypothetical protein
VTKKADVISHIASPEIKGFLEIGLFLHEIKSSLRQKGYGLASTELLPYLKFMRYDGLGYENIGLIFEKMFGIRSGFKDGQGYVAVSVSQHLGKRTANVYFFGHHGGVARSLLELEDAYERFYNGHVWEKLPNFMKIAKTLNTMGRMDAVDIRYNSGIPHEKGAMERTLYRMRDIGLVEVDGQMYAPSHALKMAYSPSVVDRWESLKNWEHRIQAVDLIRYANSYRTNRARKRNAKLQ